jgi:hypothetical protein
MAYMREAKEAFEVAYPLDAIWEALPKAVAKIQWKIEEADEAKHHVKIKTRGAILSYGSKMEVELAAIDEKTTKMTVTAETPVTTITAVADYGRTRERIAVLISTLGNIMSGS